MAVDFANLETLVASEYQLCMTNLWPDCRGLLLWLLDLWVCTYFLRYGNVSATLMIKGIQNE